MNIIFDLDDTLYDLAEPFRRVHVELFGQRLGEECSELFRMSRLYSDVSLAMEKEGKIPPTDGFYHRIHPTYLDVGVDLERDIIDEFEKRYRAYQKQITLSEDIAKVLNYCKEAGHNMSILTNGKIQGQMAKVKLLGLFQWFDKEHIFVSDMTGFHKPALETFQYVQKRLGVPSNDLWYVGDTYHVDVLGAKRAGWNAIWFNHRGIVIEDGENQADRTVTSAKELIEVLKKIS